MEGQSWVVKAEKLLQFNKSQDLVNSWTEFDIRRRLDQGESNAFESNKIESFRHSKLLAFLYQGAGIKLDDIYQSNSQILLKKSYEMWKTIWYLEKPQDDVDYVKRLFHLVSTGLITDSFAEVRMVLKDIDLEGLWLKLNKHPWPLYLENSIYLLLLILIRKNNGWDDIKFTQRMIEDIQGTQDNVEEVYLNGLGDYTNPYSKVCWLGALLNLLEAVDTCRKYILTGQPGNIDKIIIRFCRDAYELLVHTNKDDEKFAVILFEKTLLKMVQVSLWNCAYGISEKIDKYIELLMARPNNRPIFELWPSQQKAISNNLFDTSKTAIVVQMPTSAGKTLLSKFYTLQTLNLYSDAKIAYLVPTRALVNQVKIDLKNDFKNLGYRVDVSIPFSELDPIEDELLLKNTDIIVTTPEKLDILMRAKHPLISKLKLVVVDEAHGLQEKNRGARLEMLLSILRKDNRNLRILMLSPFINNAKDIASWLGENRGHEIYVDWKPSQQFTGMYELEKVKRGSYKSVIKYIPSSLNSMYKHSFNIEMNTYTNKSLTKLKKAYETAKVYEAIGGVLVLCTKRGYAENLAKLFLSRKVIKDEQKNNLNSLLALIEQELGSDSLLYQCICRGYAYHHSSLPLIIREEIEEAVANKLLNPIIATTTLAQGMNFPISTVIFQGMSIPEESSSRPMKDSEFWNIAGRAGRALIDKEGHIIAITDSENEVTQFKEYLKRKDQEVLSSLFETLEMVPDDGLNMYWLEKSKALSSLLQYIYHIMLIGEVTEISDILRGSLVYHQLTETGRNDLAEKLIRLTRNYIDKIDGDLRRKKLMESIDKTGLSSISMHFLLNRLRNHPELSLSGKEVFKYEDNNLKDIIDIVSSIPEIELSVYKAGGDFSAELVSNITKDWVNGKCIREIADKNFEIKGNIKNIDDKIRQCGKYIYGTLINNLPWGVAAIQRAKGIIDGDEINSQIESNLIPSYIYFGVKSKEAVAFSILGVPRFAAEYLAKSWREHKGDISKSSLSVLKDWLEKSTEDDWISLFSKTDRNKAKMAFDLWKKQRG